ncbi:family 20 glycosylhydrolase [Halomicrobium katesii]|uniref:family 20 glycosylhydrolase n=1 Tax=Halomicrobium katesii TaxID=437163 RepID=UPI0012BAB9CE|nr:family 20 glycosylhydrolase [Halomicrobium katesii]
MRETRRNILRKASALSALAIGVSGTASAADCSDVQQWQSGTAYNGGDRVVYDDGLWEAEWWTQANEPEESDSVWTKIGDCGGDTENEAPVASFTASISTPAPGESVTFDASGSSDPDGSVSSYAWDFGDGDTATGETASHIYGSAGDYTVTLTVTDDDGASGTASTTVSVSESDNEAPNASFTVSPSSPTTGESVTVDAADSSDADGSISSYAWDFGDDATASGQTATHTYDSSGEYTITLTVTDDDGATDTNATTVSVGGDGGECSGVSEWDSGATYTGGDQVIYDGTLWEAKWWSKGDEPSSDGSPWKQLTACGPPEPVTKTLADLVPKPDSVATDDDGFEITSSTTIVAEGSGTEVGQSLADLLGPATGFDLSVESGSSASADSIALLLNGAPSSVGDEGYELSVDSDGVTIRANEAAGLFYGVQSLRQVLPAAVEADTEQSVDWVVPGGSVTDTPRFEYRGAMLDVARHFFDKSVVKEFIDQVAAYKINHLHLHLTDDQGWRIEIDDWPNLTDEGADSEVDGGPGGYFTKADYQEIIQYAQDRHMTVVPEIDMPGHTGAALESYAELNCDDTKREEDTGINVGDTTLCMDDEHKETSLQFASEVISAVAEMTDGPYFHVGGDEADVLSDAKYEEFMDAVLPMIEDAGKTPIGWHQIASTEPVTSALLQYWGTDAQAPEVAARASEGNDVIASPAHLSYLDQDYNYQDGVGQDWAGPVSVEDAYTWDPGSYIDGVDESSVAGVEAPLWTEFVETQDDIEYMVFPRLAAIAELGWSSSSDIGDFDAFSQRLALQGPRWAQANVNYYQSDLVDWQ